MSPGEERTSRSMQRVECLPYAHQALCVYSHSPALSGTFPPLALVPFPLPLLPLFALSWP